MLGRFDAGSRAGRHDGESCHLTPDPVAALGKTTCQFLDLRLEREQCIAGLREIAAGGIFHCVATPVRRLFGRTHKGSANST
jgi:hypothetical protein